MGPWRWISAAADAEQPRWFLWAPVLLGLGIGIYFALPWEPSGLIGVALLAVVIVARLAVPLRGSAVLMTGALATVAAGLVIAKTRTEIVRAPVVAEPTRAAEVRGHLEVVEPRVARGQRLTIRVVSIAGMAPEATPGRVRVRTLEADPTLAPGEPVRLAARLSPPAPPALPGAFDFARQAWFLGIGGVGFSMRRAERDPSIGAPPLDLRLKAVIARFRQAIGRRIVAALPGETGRIANALITGERGGISEATNSAFRDSGLFHILSISGLHMVIMAGAVFFSIRLVLAAIPRIALRHPIKKWAATGAAIAALGYLLISGSAFATVRSYLMISIMFLAVLLDRPAVALRNVALAALIILTLYPESLLDVGFQMSFAAVVALVSTYEMIRDRPVPERTGPRWVGGQVALFFGGIVASTLIASLAVAPFAAYHFHKSQQYAILANLIAIPICNIIVMPAALATLLLMPLGLEAWPLWLMGKGIEAMVWCAEAVARLPGAVGRIPATPHAAFIAMVAGGLWLGLWRRRWRLLGLIPIVAGAAMAPFEPRADLLVGRDGLLVAARMTDGRLGFIAPRAAAFEVSRWLEHDGDARTVEEALKSEGFACDDLGCVAKVAGLTLAVPFHAAALRDDCLRAGVLVLRGVRPRRCAPGRIVIEASEVRRLGPHAVYVTRSEGAPPSVRIETVGAARGERPWSKVRAAPPVRVPAGSGARGPDETRAFREGFDDER